MAGGSASVRSTIASRDSLEIIEEPTKIDYEKDNEKKEEWSSVPSRPHRQRRAGLNHMTSHMVESRRHSAALIRRFDRANLRGVLGLEREIAELEQILEVEENKTVVDEGLVRALEREMRKLVKEYYECALLTKEMLALSRPTTHTLNETRRAFPPDHGQSNFILSKYHIPSNFADLSSLAPCPDSDILTRIFEKFSEGANVTHLVTFLSALCAVFFLVGGMVGLYFVESIRARLGLVGMFTVLFAAMIATLTSSRRQEVFVATAAYAAVLVVFVSGNIAANPEPTICMLADANGNAANVNADSLGTASGLLNTAAAATVTAVATSTLTFSETGSMRTILNTVTSTISSSPTVTMKKGEMSGLTKTGIGVGAALGALFILMLLGAFVVWVRERTWFGEGGLLSCFQRRRGRKESTERRTGRMTNLRAESSARRPNQSVSRSRASRGKGKERLAVEKNHVEGNAVWV
ncbi:hypothetical protein K458DRAFT_415066 [Lentithecium fluviatile CBS 122367]|uniref:DUF6594 domain-containing protein n=1 Tax=Lentithecium fluviatile CBS 122367 TaxID=1168545 RepID=A0A6G1JCV6_9PLEO|nr:hypothetical protein K458DRAFT_415066 [Lentithecium fluviatile CBS 122367]